MVTTQTIFPDAIASRVYRSLYARNGRISSSPTASVASSIDLEDTPSTLYRIHDFDRGQRRFGRRLSCMKAKRCCQASGSSGKRRQESAAVVVYCENFSEKARSSSSMADSVSGGPGVPAATSNAYLSLTIVSSASLRRARQKDLCFGQSVFWHVGL